jgi:hypothetical protein
MRRVIQWYRLFNILSLDIVAGALLSALFFARLLHVDVLQYGLIALGLTVWVIYTADHLRDAWNIRGEASSARHRFHQLHFRTLVMFELIAMLADALVIFFMRKPLLVWGAVLAAAVFVYLVIQRYLRFLKEAFVACLYTCGVVLPSITITTDGISISHLLLTVLFGMIALLNLFIFSWFGYEQDKTDLQSSVVTSLGKIRVATGIWITALINLLLAVYLISRDFYTDAVVILLVMNLVLFAVYAFSKNLFVNDRYRLIGDAVFLLPGIYLLWAHP